jgi:hypothetical protein
LSRAPAQVTPTQFGDVVTTHITPEVGEILDLVTHDEEVL